MTPVARNILLACIAGYALQQFLFPWAEIHLALWPLGDSPGAAPFRPWQLLSYGFLHGSFIHLFMNMFALYMFGPDIERLVGSRRFLIYYLVCVITAAATQLIVMHTVADPSPTVGASGGVFGLLLAFGIAFPKRKLMLIFPPIPLPAWLFVTLYGLLELYLGFSGRDSNVAHFAHLGGMIGGFALIVYWRAQHLRR